MLDREGNAYGMDFGIARSLEAEEAPQKPSKVNPQISKALEEIILECL